MAISLIYNCSYRNNLGAIMDVLKAMRVYVAVVESGSLVGAAEGIGTSGAAVSRHVAALEDHLGARLLNRTTRRLSITDAGHDYFARAQQILADVVEAEALAGESAANPSGLLRISAPMSFGINCLSRWLPAFTARYPDLKLDLDLSDRQIDLANEGIDVAVRIARQPASTNVIARRIAPVRTLLCAAPNYLDRRGRPKVPADLVGHDTLGFSYLLTGDNWSFRNVDGHMATARIHPQIKANNGDILCELALQGLGLIYEPHFIVERHINSGRLEPILTDWMVEDLNLYALYLSRKFLSAKVRVFIDHLTEMEGTREVTDQMNRF
jgi:DNA-binding transcriptional LysR family regulator